MWPLEQDYHFRELGHASSTSRKRGAQMQNGIACQSRFQIEHSHSPGQVPFAWPTRGSDFLGRDGSVWHSLFEEGSDLIASSTARHRNFPELVIRTIEAAPGYFMRSYIIVYQRFQMCPQGYLLPLPWPVSIGNDWPQ
eukprot:6177368-Pleurochrysis_carterae.AAC.2